MLDRDSSGPDDERVLAAALAIADGTPVNWEALGTTGGPDDPSLPAGLVVVERLVRGHAAARVDTSRQEIPAPTETILTSARARARQADDALEVRWGPLIVSEKVGRGSFGDVYRAWDPRLEREVALKLVPEGRDAAETPAVEEGRLLARVRHPNVLAVYGAERIDGRVGIWTEFVAGDNLALAVAREGPMSAAQAAGIGLDLCRALQAVHDAGLLHRDVKAQNVLRDRTNRIVLSDFGSGAADRADVAADDAGGTGPRAAGTPLYLAPEVFAGLPASVQSDLYSLGVLLFFLVTGSYPVRGRNLADIRAAHASGRRTRLGEERPELPGAFAAIVDRLLEADPRRRFDSATAVETALDDWLGPPTARPPEKSFGAWAVGGAVTLGITLAVAWAVWPVPDRGRIGGLGTGTAPIRQQILDAPCPGVPSLAGTWPCVVREAVDDPGRLAIYDFTSGESRTVVQPADGRIVQSPVISPDGSQVVYFETENAASPGRPDEVRLVDVSTGRDRRLLTVSDGEVLWPQHFGPDGMVGVYRGNTPSGRPAFGLLDPASGKLESVFDYPRDGYGSALSPDGRLVAFVVPGEPDASHRDVRVCELLSRECSIVSPHPANDFNPAFTPDGQLLFNSDRDGTNGLWRVRLRGPREAAPPELVRDLGRVTMSVHGFAADGTMFYGLDSGSLDIYAVESGPEAPRAPVRLSARALSDAKGPAWAPAGESLAYVTKLGPDGQEGAVRLIVQSVRDRRELEVPLPNAAVQWSQLAWSPDGALVGVRSGVGSSRLGVFGIQLVDTATGRLLGPLVRPADAQALRDGVTQRGASFEQFAWLDNRRILFQGPRQLGALDVVTGEEELLWTRRGRGRITAMALSPDRTRVALGVSHYPLSYLRDGAPPGETLRTTVTLRSLVDGSMVDLAEMTNPVVALTFSSNGQHVFYGRIADWDPGAIYQGQAVRLWQVPVEGGPSEPTEIVATGLEHLTAHPDGRRLSFTAEPVSPRGEFWMERDPSLAPGS